MANKERCDHCKKWVRECELVIPDKIPIEYQDGSIGVCEKCVYDKRYTEDYWLKWFEGFKNKKIKG